MIKNVLVFLFFSLIALPKLYAQDLIVKLNGDEIRAKIIEIDSLEIKYKKTSLPDGPLFTLDKSEVHEIKYGDGKETIINQKELTTNKSKSIAKDTATLSDTLKNKVIHKKVKHNALGKKEMNPEYKYAFKTNLFLMAFGEYSVFYERALNNRFSFELRGGITRPSTFVNGFATDLWFNFRDREKKFGYAFGSSLRFYPKLVFENFYFATDIRYRTFLMKLIKCDQNPIDKNESINNLDLRLLIGYSAITLNQYILDYFIGIGLRKIDKDCWECDAVPGNPPLINVKEQLFKPQFTIGIKVGLGY